MVTRSTELDAISLLHKEIASIPLLTAEENAALAKRIREGTIKPHRRYSREPAKLTPDGLQALNTLCTHNLRLLRELARRKAERWRIDTHSSEMLDLFQAGYFGLRKAGWKFKPSKGEFTTVAAWWIRDALTRHIMKTRNLVRIPVGEMKLITRVRRIEYDLFRKLEREPTLIELAEAAGHDDWQELNALLLKDRPTVSFDFYQSDENGDSQKPRGVAISPTVCDYVGSIDSKKQVEVIRSFISRLEGVEKDLATRRWDLYRSSNPRLTHDILGKEYSIDRRPLGRIEQELKKRLQAELEL